MSTFRFFPALALWLVMIQACSPIQEARYSMFPSSWAPWDDGLPQQTMAHLAIPPSEEVYVGASWSDPSAFLWEGLPSERLVQGDNHPLADIAQLKLRPEGIALVALSPEHQVPVWYVEDLTLDQLQLELSTPIEPLYELGTGLGSKTMHVIANEETFARFTGDIARDALFMVEFGRWALLSTHSQALEWTVGAFTKTHPRLSFEASNHNSSEPSGDNNLAGVYSLEAWSAWLAGMVDYVHRPMMVGITGQLGHWVVDQHPASDIKKRLGEDLADTETMTLRGSYQAGRHLQHSQKDVHQSMQSNTNSMQSGTNITSSGWLASMIHHPGFTPSLHQHVPDDAAGFAIAHAPIMETKRWASWLENQTSSSGLPLDSTLLAIGPLLDNSRADFRSETGLMLFSESGLDASSEWVHLRAIERPARVEELFEELVDNTLADQEGGLYVFERGWPVVWLGAQPALQSMIQKGHSPASFSQRLWVRVTNDALIMANRPGLVESIPTRASSQSLGAWIEGGGEQPQDVTFMAGGRFDDLNQFMRPWQQDLSRSLPASWQRQERFLWIGKPMQSGQGLDDSEGGTQDDMSTTTQEWELIIELSEEQDKGWENRWLYPASRTTLTHAPRLRDIGGSRRLEVLYSTKGGAVGMLASDGTQLLQLSTGVDTPIGPPVTYDWYGTNQDIIFQAAGRSIYAWDPSGRLLPSFPLQLEEEITTPLTLGDVDGNGLPDLLLGTGDGKVWVLDGRGTPLPGWPQQVLSTQREPIYLIPGSGGASSSVMTVNENALYMWNRQGELQPEFPSFAAAPFTGGASVDLSEGEVMLSSLNGQVFDYEIQIEEGGSPTLTIVDTLQVVQESRQGTLLPSISSNGPYTAWTTNFGYVFVHDQRLDTLYTTRMPGNATAEGAATILDMEGQSVMVAATESGQATAWSLPELRRVDILPPGRIESFTFGDVEQDGDLEWVAKTPAGIQTWTIYPSKVDPAEADSVNSDPKKEDAPEADSVNSDPKKIE
ncbi:MAG: FG-GAP repeat protein [Balneolaceae bacterium]|nr:FG-GAP repeat protein [Balneolaceae bacterium]